MIRDSERDFLQILKAALRGDEAETLHGDTEADVLRLAGEQLLLPMVLEACRSNEKVKSQPDFAAQRIKACDSYARQLIADSKLRALLPAMHAAGLEPLPVKGLLCRELYPDGCLRISTDEDLYVRPEECAAVYSFLENLGFERADKSAADGACEERVYGDRKTGLCLEIHPDFLGGSKAFECMEEQLKGAFDRRTEYRFKGVTLRSLSPEDHLLFLIFHAAKHFVHSGFGVRQVMDIGLWGEKYAAEIEWDRVHERLKKSGTAVFAAAVFGICRKYFGLPLDAAAKWPEASVDCEALLPDLMEAGIYGTSDMSRQHSASVTLHQAEARAEGRSGSGIKAVIKAAFPPAKRLGSAYPFLQKRPWLLPAAWGKRWFKYLKELKKRDDSSAVKALAVAAKREKLLEYYGLLAENK